MHSLQRHRERPGACTLQHVLRSHAFQSLDCAQHFCLELICLTKRLLALLLLGLHEACRREQCVSARARVARAAASARARTAQLLHGFHCAFCAHLQLGHTLRCVLRHILRSPACVSSTAAHVVARRAHTSSCCRSAATAAPASAHSRNEASEALMRAASAEVAVWHCELGGGGGCVSALRLPGSTAAHLADSLLQPVARLANQLAYAARPIHRVRLRAHGAIQLAQGARQRIHARAVLLHAAQGLLQLRKRHVGMPSPAQLRIGAQRTASTRCTSCCALCEHDATSSSTRAMSAVCCVTLRPCCSNACSAVASLTSVSAVCCCTRTRQVSRGTA